MKTAKNILISALWGVASFVFVYFVVPAVFIASPDIFWICLCIAMPVLAAVLLFKKFSIRPAFLLIGLLVQFGLLALLSTAVSHSWGINMQGLGAFEYMSLFVYPAATTVASWVLIRVLNKKQ